MKLLNYIGEFLLFRWLFGKLRKSATEHDAHADGIGTTIDNDSKYLHDNHNEDVAPIDDTVTPVSNNSIDDSDSSEDLDDLDIFMRNNNVNNHPCLNRGNYSRNHHSSSHNSDYHNWDSESYNQSFDDFHDEQDDYDMMGDDF